MIKDIDNFAKTALSIPIEGLMERSGEAVARAVRKKAPKGAHVVFLAGCGNNGGDGYAAATKLMNDYRVEIYDVFSKGQKSDAGKFWLSEYINLGGSVINGLPSKNKLSDETDVLVDAIFGTGFSGNVPAEIIELSRHINTLSKLCVIAVDIPLGVSADDGTVEDFALRADLTVSLSFPKVAMFSYPAKGYVGEVAVDDIGLDIDIICKNFEFKNHFVDFNLAKELLPKREDNTNKGSFGKALLMVGSKEYMGAAFLALETALRGGTGYVTYLGDDSLCDHLLLRFPEAIYKRTSLSNVEAVISASEKQSAILVGSGSGCSIEVFEVIKALLETPGAPIVIDADGINSIARFGSRELLKQAQREVILTPHPLEFSRLSGVSVDEIGANRYSVAKSFAKEYGCVILLKGAATVITDGEETYINGAGSSALAKAGSGDVLSGLLVSILAYNKDALKSAALAAYIHARVGDVLSNEYSSYGVTPSDIPKNVAKIMAEIEKGEIDGIS